MSKRWKVPEYLNQKKIFDVGVKTVSVVLKNMQNLWLLRLTQKFESISFYRFN